MSIEHGFTEERRQEIKRKAATTQVEDRITLTEEGAAIGTKRFGIIPTKKHLPDTTKEAIVIGFSRKTVERRTPRPEGVRPGVYFQKDLVDVQYQGGSTDHKYIGDMNFINHTPHEPVRLENGNLQYVEELPDTPFWEGDIVRVSNTDDYLHLPNKEYTILMIDYETLEDKNQANYKISKDLGGGSYKGVAEGDMKLVRRGNIWRLHHGEPLEFQDIWEEATFWEMQGATTELQVENGNHYGYNSVEAAMQAVESGYAHGLQQVKGIDLGPSYPYVGIIRYNDEELGERVRRATLALWEETKNK